MFELGRERAITGNGGPAVVEQLHFGTSDIDHWFDGEEHAGLKLRAGPGPTCMDHFRAIVEQSAKSMAAEVANNAVAVPFRMALDRMGNISQAVAGLCLFKPQHQAFIGDLDQLLGLKRYVADSIHAACVAMPTVQNGGHVDVDDVAILERLVTRNTVADDMVDRSAAALGISRDSRASRVPAPASNVIRRTISSISPVVTPGTTCGTSASRMEAASWPARRIPSNPSGPWSLIT